ncbi:hypothetical protein [Paenibacillus donghaensis]|uniref:Uncharacterized protein n=1 Tax=Paenibacillus donghaensis TaxID=414771 RepID=A0A2Z2KCB9_9BACL|nr:hypothetical protein [Paenibacillus donghaensis]ASA20630.1 hypothetical protein B9T62_07375 [Paenibacillus donghaensis]
MNRIIRRSFILTLIMALFAVPSAFAAGKDLSSVINVTGYSTELSIGEQTDLFVNITDYNVEGIGGVEFTPVSSDTSVLQVKYVGSTYSELTAVGEGAATITYNIGEGYNPYTINFTVGKASQNSTPNEDAPDSSYNQAIEDLNIYIEQLEKIEKYESLAFDSYNKNTFVTNNTRKKVLSAFDQTILPNYSKFVYHLKTLTAPNAELQKIHNTYVKGAKLQLEGMTLMRKSLYKSKVDFKTFDAANIKIKSGLKSLTAAMQALEDYAELHLE